MSWYPGAHVFSLSLSNHILTIWLFISFLKNRTFGIAEKSLLALLYNIALSRSISICNLSRLLREVPCGSMSLAGLRGHVSNEDRMSRAVSATRQTGEATNVLSPKQCLWVVFPSEPEDKKLYYYLKFAIAPIKFQLRNQGCWSMSHLKMQPFFCSLRNDRNTVSFFLIAFIFSN